MPTGLTSNSIDELVKESINNLHNGRALPSVWYTDPEIFEVEKERIFRRSWQYACNVDDLQKPGDFFSGQAAGTPYVITRNKRGELNAHLNICRHRLHHVVEGNGNATVLQCPYHGWTYDLCGELRGVPRKMELQGEMGAEFDRSKAGLLPLSVDTWGPLVFVNPDPDAAQLSETLGPIPEIAEKRQIDLNLPRRAREEFTIKCNWKIFVDNILECYHCPTVHPILNRTHDVQNVQYEYFGCAGAQVIKARPGIEGETGPDTRDHHASYVWPTLWLSGRSGESYFLLITDPIDASTTRVIKEAYCPADMPEKEVQERMATFSRVVGEDVGVAESTQRGHEVGMTPAGYLATNIEVTVRHFAGLVLDALSTDSDRPPVSVGRVVTNTSNDPARPPG